MKKICDYQRYLNMISKKYPTNVGALSVLYFFTIFAAVSFSAIKESILLSIFCIPILFGFNVLMNNRKPELRVLPVSDKFAIRNLIYIFPVRLCVIVTAIIVAAIIAFTGISIATQETTFEFLMASMPIENQFIVGLIYGILFFLGYYFLLWLTCVCFFLSNQKYYVYSGYGIFIVLFIGITFGLKKVIQYNGAIGEIFIYQLKDYVPFAWSILIIIWVATIFIAIVDWRIGLRIYRSGSNMNWMPTTESHGKTFSAGKKGTIVISLIVVSIIIYILLIPIGGFFSGYDNQIDYYSNSAEQYHDCESWEMDFGESKTLIFSNLSVLFPEDVQKDTVNNYYAGAEGGYEGDEDAYSTNITSYRYLSITLDESDYQKEKERISNISVNQDGQTYYLYHDTTHFQQEAYIAVYDSEISEFEYVLLDDENSTIQYILTNGITPDQTPAGNVCLPTHDAFQVVPASEKRAYGDSDRYSIYDFMW